MTSDDRPRAARRYLTADVPAVAARFRERIEDFVVEEVPRYEPSGTGTHAYLWIEKRGIPTAEAVRRLAKRLGKRPRDVGFAGLKDARAVARQTLSIEHAGTIDPERLSDEQVTVLAHRLHGNKLKRGHLRGNRFAVRLRGVARERVDDARRVLDALAARGTPAFFGSQRFGSSRQENARLGFSILAGRAQDALDVLLGRPVEGESAAIVEARTRYDAGDLAGAIKRWPRPFEAERRALQALLGGRSAVAAVRAIPRNTRQLYVSAAQSEVFNGLLAERIDEGTHDRVLRGDVAYLHDRGACFVVEDPGPEAPRAASFEISPAGPLFGDRLLAASGRPGEREAAAFARYGVDAPASDALVGPPPGARRPYRVPVTEAGFEVEDRDPGASHVDVVLRFTLPAGAFATAVIGEVLKQPL